jgi:hypothetical protein
LSDYESRIECGDGLNFWWSTQQLGKSAGTIRILNGSTNSVLKLFNPDFGGKLSHQFTVNKKIGAYTAVSTYNYLAYKFPDTIKKDTVKNFIVSPFIQNSSWTVFPNPTVDKSFTISFPEDKNADKTLSIQSLDGRVIFVKSYQKAIVKDLIRLPSQIEGTYIVTLECGDRKFEEKLILK